MFGGASFARGVTRYLGIDEMANAAHGEAPARRVSVVRRKGKKC